MSPSAISTYLLNSCRDGVSTTPVGSLFPCLTTLSVKNIPWYPYKPPLTPFPLIMLLVTWEKTQPTPTCLQFPFKWLWRSHRRPLYSRLNSIFFHQTCAPEPSSAPLLFPGLTPALLCPSCSETELDTGFKAWPPQCWAQGHDCGPDPAGHTNPSAGHDVFGFLGHLAAHWLMFNCCQPALIEQVSSHFYPRV